MTFQKKLFPLHIINLLLAFGSSLLTASELYTVDSILAHMKTEEAKYEDITIQYKEEWYRPSISDKAIMVSDAIYSHSMSHGGFRMRKTRTRIVDPNSPTKKRVEDMAVSFNGQSMFIFNGPSLYNKTNQGFIKKGYDEGYFLSNTASPYAKTWCMGGSPRKWTDVIKQYISDFQIESTSESIEGLPVITLVGYADNGRTKLKLWVCPERNYLPLKQQIWEDKKSRLVQEVGLYDLRQLENGAWFPMLIKFPADPPAIPDAKVTITQSVQSVSIEPEKDFSLEFPPNTYVIDEVNEVSYRTIDPKQENNQ